MKIKRTRKKITHTVPVLLKAVRVLEAVAQSETNASVKGLASTLNISPTTCYRILQSYVASGWLRPGSRGTFQLSFGLVPLLRPLLRHELLIETVRDSMTSLTQTTGLTAKLTVRQGHDAVTIYATVSPRSHSITSRVGSVVSLAIGSSGAVFLSTLSDKEIDEILTSAPSETWHGQQRTDVLRRIREVRKHGIVFDSGSFQPHINTLSAPLQAQDRQVIGAITLLGLPQDFQGSAKSDLILKLRYAAGGCNQLIQGTALETSA